MPKKSRGVARYAATNQRRRGKRRAAGVPPQEEATPSPGVPRPQRAAPSFRRPESPRAASPARPSPAVTRAAPDYSYVIPELRKIAVVAGAMLLLLGVLALFLR